MQITVSSGEAIYPTGFSISLYENEMKNLSKDRKVNDAIAVYSMGHLGPLAVFKYDFNIQKSILEKSSILSMHRSLEPPETSFLRALYPGQIFAETPFEYVSYDILLDDFSFEQLKNGREILFSEKNSDFSNRETQSFGILERVPFTLSSLFR